MPDNTQDHNDLPSHAHERLAQMRGQGGKRALFTSDLSVNEFLLVKEAGFEPVGMVVGSSIYHIGIQIPGMFQNQELDGAALVLACGAAGDRLIPKRAKQTTRRHFIPTRPPTSV